MENQCLAIIGGSGLYSLEELEDLKEVDLVTPFGSPSSPITIGRIGETRLAFIARHGHEHEINPTKVPYQANIYALKELGANWCLSVSAVGSLREEIAPGHLVLPDQFIDRTYLRKNTFFEQEITAHVAFADPLCRVLRQAVGDIAKGLAAGSNTKLHQGGTYICIEGPSFSTRAESKLYRSWGADIIGMTNLPEARLAREAQMSYATLALVSDYDCWRSESSDIDIEEIFSYLRKNEDLAKMLILRLAEGLSELSQPPEISQALSSAILTPLDTVSESIKEKLKPILADYLS